MRHIVPLGELHLRRTVGEFVAHYHSERNHQGLEGGGGWYPPWSFSEPPFVGGDVLTITAEGGVVPAFFAQLVAPS